MAETNTDEKVVKTDQQKEVKDDVVNECCDDINKKHSASKKKEDKEHLKIKELEHEIDELNSKLAGVKNEYYRAYADAENTKKRLQQDFEMRSKYLIQSFATEILPAIDNLERALENADKDSPLYVGVDMVNQQLINALKKEGVEEIPALGTAFDPNYHHAILTEKREGVEPNVVIEVLQKGYKLKDRILRATLVKVSE
ncbi:Protein GrpE [bioreactor metagenome]|uniref:Protein GrpE n=1 Tax=bioreactor metagenome TaxID=1076179 RepID=A0A645BDU5_9ZZZZ|nr:nucleotide exchange factor GrpE [Erysipelotrichaceae bacterium]